MLNPLKPNDHYSGRTAPLTSKHFILYIYSTNTGTEYFKHGIYSTFFFSSQCSLFHNSNVFGSCVIHILYIGRAKLKKNNSGAKRLIKDRDKIVVWLLDQNWWCASINVKVVYVRQPMWFPAVREGILGVG